MSPSRRRSARKPPGAKPGSLVYTGEERPHQPRLSRVRYNPSEVDHQQDLTPASAFESWAGEGVTWVNLDGVHDVELTRQVGEALQLESLLVEDILSTHQRPKIEDSADRLFVVVRMFLVDDGSITSEQVSLVVTHDLVVSFQETPEDVFDPIRRRIENAGGRIRSRGADYLLYALLDAIVDHYFVVLEALGDRLEALEASLLEDPSPALLHDLYKVRSQAAFIRKAAWPMREVTQRLAQLDSPLLDPRTEPFWRDLQDHAIQALDSVETYRELTSTLIDLYLSTASQRLNEVMKVLTLVATIFIPLTFIAGIYGMNFEYMPELQWRYGYFAVWSVMGAVFVGMLFFFKRKGWL